MMLSRYNNSLANFAIQDNLSLTSEARLSSFPKAVRSGNYAGFRRLVAKVRQSRGGVLFAVNGQICISSLIMIVTDPDAWARVSRPTAAPLR